MPFISTKRACDRCCDVYKCSDCPSRSFETASALISHLRKSFKHKRQAVRTFICLTCNADFKSKTGFIHHLQQKRIHKYDLHQAACCGRFQDVATLTRSENADETGASHKVKDGAILYQLGKTPLHCAAFRGYSRCLGIMLSWEPVNPNVADEFGQSPVHVAARCGKTGCLAVLLRKGGRLDIPDHEEKTPIKLATEECIVTIIRHQLTTMIDKELTKYLRRGFEGQSRLVESSVDVEGISSSEDESVQPEASGELVMRSSETPCPGIVEEEIDDNKSHAGLSSEVVEDYSNVIQRRETGQISEVSADLFPYEVIARGEKGITAFKTALAEGTSPASRLKIIVVGEPRAGKTSLTRSLSGQSFVEARKKTHGIETTAIVEPMVQNTEINVAWKLDDSSESHLDSLIAGVVSSILTENREMPSKRQVPELPPSPAEFSESQIMKAMDMARPGLSTPPRTRQEITGTSQVLITEPSITVEGSPRKLPATMIAKNLLSKKKTNLSVKVNIWDFAGHSLYEPMHHVFMNSRSLYLVVFNLLKMKESAEKSLQNIHYWLNSIASHTESSTPVILVGTHKAKVPSNFIEEAKSLCERHFAATFGPRLVRGFNEEILFAVENSQSDEDEGITSLKHVIKNDAPTSFKFVNEEFPLKWLHCEDEIIKYQQNPDNEMCVTLDKFKALLEKKCMVTFKGDELDAMVSFFHDSGLILFPGNMCGADERASVKDHVILSPQYLVDIMTKIHDFPKNRQYQRQFSDEFQKLKSEGRIGSHVLELIWKDKETKMDVLVELLSCFSLLHPLRNESDVKSTQPAARPAEYILPCMLKNKLDKKSEKRWQDACRAWSKNEPAEPGTKNEREFVFDFGRFLPPALFVYLLVRVYRHTSNSSCIKPVIERQAAIFSLSNKFLFRLKLVLKDCQIWVYSRFGKDENFLQLARMLNSKVHEICQQHFKFLRFVFGPPCPREDCPGATFNVDCVQRPCESSSSGSENDSVSGDDADSIAEGDGKVREGSQTACSQNHRRRHVIHINLDSFDPPYWCKEMDVSEHLTDWGPATTEQDQGSVEDDTDGSFQEDCAVYICCIDFVAEKLGAHWKDLGRKLKVPEAKIENISEDYSMQKEKGYQILLSWKEKQGAGAQIDELVDALKNITMSKVADELNKHYSAANHVAKTEAEKDLAKP